jgi:hypothetical protein
VAREGRIRRGGGLSWFNQVFSRTGSVDYCPDLRPFTKRPFIKGSGDLVNSKDSWQEAEGRVDFILVMVWYFGGSCYTI